MTYDSVGRRVLLFGGTSSDSADQWPRSLWAWTVLVGAASTPTARRGETVPRWRTTLAETGWSSTVAARARTGRAGRCSRRPGSGMGHAGRWSTASALGHECTRCSPTMRSAVRSSRMAAFSAAIRCTEIPGDGTARHGERPISLSGRSATITTDWYPPPRVSCSRSPCRTAREAASPNRVSPEDGRTRTYSGDRNGRRPARQGRASAVGASSAWCGHPRAPCSIPVGAADRSPARSRGSFGEKRGNPSTRSPLPAAARESRLSLSWCFNTYV